ncbi:expressed unknown protein [Seminavis robusta]|uniref:Uncharacterized protein n=1 Tax=Seminavis robusta TaxID=568900 RepID=A0A9N8H9V2_9STRA|nr:expressed unknown protein [Seminavis robusta]|eukprot:Sro269_g103920.1 n/a (717) ;mRNA; f:15054-17204
MGAQQSHDVPGWNEYEQAERLQIHFSEMMGSFTLRGQFFNFCENPLSAIFLKAKVSPQRIRACFLDGHLSALLLNHPSWLQDVVEDLLDACPNLEKFSMKLPKALPYMRRFRRILRSTIFPYLQPIHIIEGEEEEELEEEEEDEEEKTSSDKDDEKKSSEKDDKETTSTSNENGDDTTAKPKPKVVVKKIQKNKQRPPPPQQRFPLGLEIADDKLIISPDIVDPKTTVKRQIIFVYREQLRMNANNAARTPLERIWNSMIQEVIQVFEPVIQVANISTDCEPTTFQAICSLPQLHKLHFQNHVLNDPEVTTLTQILATRKRKREGVLPSASLKHLNFTNMAMRHHNFTTLCHAMETNRGLDSFVVTRLTFHTDDETTSMVDPLLQILKSNRHLKWLDATGQGGPVVVEMNRFHVPGRPMLADGDNYVELENHTETDGQLHGPDDLGQLGLDIPPPGVDGLPIIIPPAAAAVPVPQPPQRTQEQEDAEQEQKRQMALAETERQRNLERLYQVLKEHNDTVCQVRIGDLQDRQVSRMMMRRYPLPPKIQTRLDMNTLGLTKIMDAGGCSSSSVLGQALVYAKKRAKSGDFKLCTKSEVEEEEKLKQQNDGTANDDDDQTQDDNKKKKDEKRNDTSSTNHIYGDGPARIHDFDNDDSECNLNGSKYVYTPDDDAIAVGPRKRPILLDSLFCLFQEHPTLVSLIPVHETEENKAAQKMEA